MSLVRNDMDQEAVYTFFTTTSAVTPKAADVKNRYLRWYNDLGFWDKAWSDEQMDKARSFRSEFNYANARTKEETQQIRNVLESGFTREETRGEDRPDIDVDTGEFNPKPFFDFTLPIWFKPAALLTAVGITTIAVLKKVRLL